MNGKVCYLLLGVALLRAAGGCQHPHATTCAPDSLAVTPTLAPVARGSLRSDLGQVAAGPSCPAPAPAPPAEYRALTEERAQCLASVHSPRANYLDAEAEALERGARCSLIGVLTHARQNRALEQQVLHYTALEDRNRNAGRALEQYFRLAESEAKAELLRSGLGELERTLQDVNVLKAKGLKVPPELESLEDQGLQLRGDLARLENAIAALNDSLARQTGLEPCGRCWRLRPTLDASPPPASPDLASAVALAYENRPSLQLSRILAHESRPQTLPAMKRFMQLTTGVPGAASLVAGSERREFPARQAQLDRLNREAERLVREEVCQALHDVQAQAELVCLVRARLAGQQARLRELEDKVAKGIVSSVHLLAPRLQADRLEADLLHEVADWHIARVKLKQAQGLLVVECQAAGPGGTPCLGRGTVE